MKEGNENTMQYIIDAHCHTVLSGHAYSTIKEYAEESARKGLSLIAFTDHSEGMPGGAPRMNFLNLHTIPGELFGVELLTGIELNILDPDGTVDLKDEYYNRLDVVIASLHSPCFKPKSIDENTAAMVNTIKNPYINVLGHPGDPRYPIDIKEVVTAARDNNTVLELNNSSMLAKSPRSGGEEILTDLLKECERQALPVLIGSDAHIYTAIGEFSLAAKLIDSVNFPKELILNTSVMYFKEVLKTKR